MDTENYSDFLLHLEKENERELKRLIKNIDIATDSDDFFLLKKQKFNKERIKYIKYITKRDKSYTYEDLMTYETRDLVLMYNTLREKRKKTIKNIIGLFINK